MPRSGSSTSSDRDVRRCKGTSRRLPSHGVKISLRFMHQTDILSALFQAFRCSMPPILQAHFSVLQPRNSHPMFAVARRMT
jgi:hypothetical protein